MYVQIVISITTYEQLIKKLSGDSLPGTDSTHCITKAFLCRSGDGD